MSYVWSVHMFGQYMSNADPQFQLLLTRIHMFTVAEHGSGSLAQSASIVVEHQHQHAEAVQDETPERILQHQPRHMPSRPPPQQTHSQHVPSQERHSRTSFVSNQRRHALSTAGCSRESAVQRNFVLSSDGTQAENSQKCKNCPQQPFSDISCSSQASASPDKSQQHLLSSPPLVSRSTTAHATCKKSLKRIGAGVQAWPPLSPSPKKFLHSQNRRP